MIVSEAVHGAGEVDVESLVWLVRSEHFDVFLIAIAVKRVVDHVPRIDFVCVWVVSKGSSDVVGDCQSRLEVLVNVSQSPWEVLFVSSVCVEGKRVHVGEWGDDIERMTSTPDRNRQNQGQPQKTGHRVCLNRFRQKKKNSLTMISWISILFFGIGFLSLYQSWGVPTTPPEVPPMADAPDENKPDFLKPDMTLNNVDHEYGAGATHAIRLR